MLDIDKIATKMSLLGGKVKVITPSTLIQNTEQGESNFYKLIDKQLKLIYNFKNIEHKPDREICITTRLDGLKGIIDIQGKTIVSPGFKDINTDVDGVLIVTLANGLKSITDNKGNELIPYMAHKIHPNETKVGIVFDIWTASETVVFKQLRYEDGKYNIVDMKYLNNKVYSGEYKVEYDRIKVKRKEDEYGQDIVDEILLRED